MPSVRVSLARLAGALLRSPLAPAHARRHHRHQRQDDDVLPGRGAAARARPRHRGHRHDPVRAGRRDAPGQPDDAGGARAPGDARRRCATRGVRRRRHGGVVARAVARPRRRPRVRRGGVHEPHAGSPRLSRHARGLSARQAPAVRAARRIAQAPSHRRRERGRSGGRDHGGGARRGRPDLRLWARGACAGHRARLVDRRHPDDGRDAARARGAHVAAHRRAQRDEPARRRGDRARGGPRAARHRPGPRGSRHRAGTLRASAGRPAVPGGRRLRPHPRRARARPDDRAQAHARPARRRLRLRRRPRPRQATDHGRDRRAARRPRVGHLRQPALGAAGGDHRRDRGRRAPDRRGGEPLRDRGRPGRGDPRRPSAWAEGGDTVVIAGKGHETYQIIGADVLPFDDREVARQILSKARS